MLQQNQAQQEDDISYESSSNSSKTSKIGQNDPLLLDMALVPMKVLVPKYFVPNFLFHVLRQVTNFVELGMVERTFAIGSMYFFAIFQPLCDLLAYDIPYALSMSGAFYVARNLAKNQLVAANIYFMHQFLVSLLYCIVVLIFFMAFLKNYFNEGSIVEFDATILGTYSTIRCPVACFINLVNYSCIPFLQAECRYFALMMKELLESFTSILAMVIMTTRYEDINEGELTLDNMAYGCLVGQLSGTVVMIFCVWKIPFLDVQYKGALFFTPKRLSPVRPKIILQICWNLIPFLGIEIYDIIATVNAAFMGHTRYFSVKQVDYIDIYHVRVLCYIRIRLLLKAFLKAFRDVFQAIAGYNMQVKKLSRIFESFYMVLAYQYGICVPVFALFIYLGPIIVKLTYDHTVVNFLKYWELVEIEVHSQVLEAAWGMLLPLPFYLAVTFLLLEQKVVLAIAIQVPGFVFAIFAYYQQYKYCGDNADYLLSVQLGDVCSALFSYAVLGHFAIKYYGLYKMNRNSGDAKETKLAEANTELRESMLQYLERPEDDEEEEQAQKKQQPGKVFNKDMALRSSKQFISLRESITKNADPSQRESAAEEPK